MQCKGINKDGTQCQRNVLEDSGYCHQHIHGMFNTLTYYIANLIGVKRRFLLWFFIFALIVFIIQGYAGYQYMEILEKLEYKADAEIELSPYLYESTFGEYLPLIVTNTGDYTLSDVDIAISTCTMIDKNVYELYSLPLLPTHSSREIPFGNKETINEFKSANCYPFAGNKRTHASMKINPWNLSKGEDITTISTGCGYCYFNAIIKANIIATNETFEKRIRSTFPYPVDLEITYSLR